MFVRLMLVCWLVRTTSTPGMTPPESLIDPRSPPWNPWPNAEPVMDTSSDAPRMSDARILMVPPPEAVPNCKSEDDQGCGGCAGDRGGPRRTCVLRGVL